MSVAKSISLSMLYEAVEHHRNRDRIRDMGEVFTPDDYADEIIALVSKDAWSDPNAVFVEPTAGTGNIVICCLRRRINTLRSSFIRKKLRNPTLCAVATAINSFWALDLCAGNIEVIKQRVFSLCISSCIIELAALEEDNQRDYVSHLLCAICTQFQQNEALSCLAPPETALTHASRTRAGERWITDNRHKPLNPGASWSVTFDTWTQRKLAHPLHVKAKRFLEEYTNTQRGTALFAFVEPTLANSLAYLQKAGTLR